MKKFLLFFSVLFAFSSVFAQKKLEDGYYRVYNKVEKRYIHVTDNTGIATVGKQDVDAIQVLFDKDYPVVSMPSSVLFLQNYSENFYDINSQGTGVRQIIGHRAQINWETSKKGAPGWIVGASLSGVDIWLGSKNDTDEKIGLLNTKGENPHWVEQRITDDGDCYFGLTPTIEVAGKFYQTFYAGFPFSFFSNGMKAYYVSEVKNNVVKLVLIAEGEIIPASTPIVVECSSKNPSNNRLSLKVSGGKAISNNLLKGVYFNNYRRISGSSDAVTSVNKNTMRVLGVGSDGKLAFVEPVVNNPNKKSDLTNYIPANQAYLPVSSGTAQKLSIEIDESGAAIETVYEDQMVVASGIYSILGVKLRDDSNIEELSSGIYIVNGKKIIKR